MSFPWEIVQYLQNFFQLSFLFSGLEISSSTLIIARLSVFIVSLAFFGWFITKIGVKALDLVQTFITCLTRLPKSFFLFLLLAIPLSSESIGAKWIGYIFVILSILILGCFLVLLLVVWRYGIDHAMRLINVLKKKNPTIMNEMTPKSGEDLSNSISHA
jgi:hypothetical protein